MSKSNHEFAAGIDLGTTNSLIAVEKSDRMEIVANDFGDRKTASVVRLENRSRVIGKVAHETMHHNTNSTLHSVKRIMGRRFSDPCVQAFKSSVGFDIRNIKGKPEFRIEHADKIAHYSPEQVSAMILKSLKSSAERYVGCAVSKAVITVPAAFNEVQRKATKTAAMIVGFEVLAIINEPTAAALQWLHLKENRCKESVLLVFDMGGGTTDVTILSIGKEGIRVISTTGDTELGGCHIDKMLEDHFVKQIRDNHEHDISQLPLSMAVLRSICVGIKEQLTIKTKVTLTLDNIIVDELVKLSMTRNEFENIIYSIRERVIALLQKALKMDLVGSDADNKVVGINDVVLVGGSSRMPWIKALLHEYFCEGTNFHKNVNCDEAVAEGAGIYASILSGSTKFRDIRIQDIAPLTYGVEVKGGMMAKIIKQGTCLPATNTRNFTTDKNEQQSVNIQIYEGTSERVAECRKLQAFELLLKNYKGSEKGAPDIEVTFSLSECFLLEVTARDVTGGGTMTFPVDVSSGCVHDCNIKKMREIEESLCNSDETEEKRLDLIYKLEKIAQDRKLPDLEVWIEGNREATFEVIEAKFNEAEKA